MSQDQQLRMLFQGKPDSHGMISTFSKRKILYPRLATFPSFRMTKSVITQGTNRCQMKDMYIIFQVVPPILLHVKWFGSDMSNTTFLPQYQYPIFPKRP